MLSVAIFSKFFFALKIFYSFFPHSSYKRDKTASFYNFDRQQYNYTQDDNNKTVKWTLSEGYLTTDSLVFPVRAVKENRVSFYLKLLESDFSGSCPKIGVGFKLFLHLPNEIMTPFHQEQFVYWNQEKTIILKAKVYTASKLLKKYKPQKRNCYFEGERKLKFFGVYTKAQCDYECLTNFTLDRCDCVRFSMPREENTAICDIDKVDCYVRAEREWSHSIGNVKDNLMPCGCLPPCEDIRYSIQYERNGEIEVDGQGEMSFGFKKHSG
jgi:acid-sensing ion channel, other